MLFAVGKVKARRRAEVFSTFREETKPWGEILPSKERRKLRKVA